MVFKSQLRNVFVKTSVLFAPTLHFSAPEGLSCVNDYVKNVSCEWLGSPVDPGENCLITGAMKAGTARKRRLAT